MELVVLDTSVVAAAFRSRRGASAWLLRLVAMERLRACATTALLLEYEAVLKRPEQRLATGLDLERIGAILTILASTLKPVDVHFRWRPQLSDPDDELVLEAAIGGRARTIVTHNVRDFMPVAKRFGVRVLRPGELIERLRE